MKETIQKRLSDSKTARWTALFIVSFTMMCGYFLTDVMSPLENLLTTKGQVVYFTDDAESSEKMVEQLKKKEVKYSIMKCRMAHRHRRKRQLVLSPEEKAGQVQNMASFQELMA